MEEVDAAVKQALMEYEVQTARKFGLSRALSQKKKRLKELKIFFESFKECQPQWIMMEKTLEQSFASCSSRCLSSSAFLTYCGKMLGNEKEQFLRRVSEIAALPASTE